MCVCVCFTKKLILHCVFDKACICEPLENYLVYFARSCQISSSELWCHEVDAEKEFERMGQSMALPVSFTEELDFCDVLPVYQRDRLGVYREQFQEHVAQARCLPSDHAVYDLERGSARPAQVYGGAPLFTLVSHGTLWHDTHMRPLTALEWCMAHGIVADPAVCGPGVEQVADYLPLLESNELSRRALKDMVGNGWHVGSVGSWLMFLLGAVEFSSATRAPRYVNPPDDAEEEMDDDGPPQKRFAFDTALSACPNVTIDLCEDEESQAEAVMPTQDCTKSVLEWTDRQLDDFDSLFVEVINLDNSPTTIVEVLESQLEEDCI